MAQDFGDDIGEMLIRAVGRGVGRIAYTYIDKNMKDWLEQNYRSKGMSAEQAAVEAEAKASREQVCIPFGSSTDASYMAQVCRENDVYAAAFADGQGNGYIQFTKDDLAHVQGCIPQFAEVLTRLQAQNIAEQMDKAQPVTPDKLSELTAIDQLPDLPKSTPAHDAAMAAPETATQAVWQSQPPNHTERIRDEVAAARTQCRDFSDFERILAAKGIGISATQAGEVLFYEARTGADGRLLPYDRDMRDWAVGADTLKQKWGIDATHDSFAKAARAAEPQVADGSLDADGRTPDINQGIESHDGMDTDTHTLRLEREQNGTDIPPSKVREETLPSHDDGRGYSLATEAHDSRAASKQLEHESGIADREIDISDKLSPVR